jgi:hypothetical protein
VKQIVVRWSGARGGEGSRRDRAEARLVARALLERARRGADFDRLVAGEEGLKVETLTVVTVAVGRRAGEYTRADLPPALGELVFQLDVGEVGLCEFHEKDAPDGWHVVLRVE